MSVFTKLSKEQLKTKINFIDNYINSENAADGSKFDSNANVERKNIATLASELHKDVNIQINRKLMYDKITQEFGEDLAKEYIRQLEAHELYKHDETSPSPYSYVGSEVVVVEIGGTWKVMPLNSLYESCDVEEILLDAEKEVFAKYPKEPITILDRGGKTSISRLIWKKRHKDLYRVATDTFDMIVTEDHPMIIGETKDDTIPASSCEGELQKAISIESEFLSIMEPSTASKEWGKHYQEGYRIGALSSCIVDTNLSVNVASFECETEAVRSNIVSCFGSEYFDYELDIQGLEVSVTSKDRFSILKHYTSIESNRTFALEILNESDAFLIGYLRAITDLDAYKMENDSYCFYSTQRFPVLQMSLILNRLGYYNKVIMTEDQKDFGVVYKTLKDNSILMETDRPVISVEKITDEEYLEENRWIYDITTDSNTFVCNGLWAHNCVSVSMYPFLLDGLKSLGGESAAPKHVESFCGSFVNLVFAISSQFAGACLDGNQRLNILDNEVPYSVKIKDLVERYDLTKSFKNEQGVWEYADPKGLKVWEKDRFVDIRRVYRRAYNDSIYTIKTELGKEVKVSKDHRFKVWQSDRYVEVRAEDLQVGDLVVNSMYDPNITYLGVDDTSKSYAMGQLLGFIDTFATLHTDSHIIFNFQFPDTEYIKKLHLLFKNIYNVSGFIRKESLGEYLFDISRVIKDINTYYKDGELERSLDLNIYAGYIDACLLSLRRGNKYTGNKRQVTILRELLSMFNVYPSGDEYSIVFNSGCHPDLLLILNLSFIKLQHFLPIHRIKHDSIDQIEVHSIDDYVYEIETSSNWYSAGGLLTHNCATVEFLMYMDHFLRKDYGDDYINTHRHQLDNHLQHVVYAINQPAAARGFQCVREDTTQLSTPEGYKYLSELKEGDLCYVWVDGKIETQPIQKLNIYDFDGELMQFKGRNYQQTVTPNHRVLYKKPNTSEYVIKEAHEVFGHSKLSCPVGSEGVDREDYGISDNLLRLCTVAIVSGHVMQEDDEHFINNISYMENSQKFIGGVCFSEAAFNPDLMSRLEDTGVGGYLVHRSRTTNLTKVDSQLILRQLKEGLDTIPYFFKLLSRRQLSLVMDTWKSLMDGEATNQLLCKNKGVQEALQELVTLVGLGSKLTSSEGSLFVEILDDIDQEIADYSKVYYSGKVWCPTTDAGVVIFREENKIPYISGNSIFWNISVFDKPYFESMFGDFVFPDMDKPKWETLDKLQRHFMTWFRKEREKAILTFPVVTAALLSDGEKPVDTEYKKFLSEEMSKSNSFFVYLSESADSLASCCFSGDQKCLTRSSHGVNYMTFKELSDASYKDTKRNFKIFHNGSWVHGNLVKLPADREMYKIITSNNKELIVSDNHIHPTIKGDLSTDQLEVGDKLLFNCNPLETFPEQDMGLTYEQGFAVGAFLGDGSYGGVRVLSTGEEKIYEINFSLNENCFDYIAEKINKANKDLGHTTEVCLGAVQNNVYPGRISSEKLVKFLQYWTRGRKAHLKELNLEALTQSKEFRQGILEGWYATDGGNSNRCYTVSEKLAEQMEVLITSLGMHSIIDVVDRRDKNIEIRGMKCSRNFKTICVRWYLPKNKRSMKDVYTYRNNSMYFDIKSIEKIDYDQDYIYCFDMKNEDEPYFTLPNGVITHNCRLRNEISDNTFSYSLGAGGVATGSISVMTINLSRLVQDGRDLRTEIQKVHKYQYAYRKIMDEYKAAGMLPVYDAGFISLDKQFLTIGINGILEAAESQGITADNNTEYKEFVSSLLKVIFDENKKAKEKYGLMYNTECIPGENTGVKFSKWDSEAVEKTYRLTLEDGGVVEYPWNTEVKLLDGSIKHVYELVQGDEISEIL